MQCYCCQASTALGRKVKLRRWRDAPEGFAADPSKAVASGAAEAYREEMTYRWSVVCLECYRTLDNEMGLAEIPGRGRFNIASVSRQDKAAVVDDEKWQKFQRQQAKKLGLED